MNVGGAAGQGLGEDAVDEVDGGRFLRKFAQARGVGAGPAHQVQTGRGVGVQVLGQGLDQRSLGQHEVDGVVGGLGDALGQLRVQRLDARQQNAAGLVVAPGDGLGLGPPGQGRADFGQEAGDLVGAGAVLGQQDGQVQLFGHDLQQLGLGNGAQAHQVQAQKAAVLLLQGQAVGQVGGADQAALDQQFAQPPTVGRGPGGKADGDGFDGVGQGGLRGQGMTRR